MGRWGSQVLAHRFNIDTRGNFGFLGASFPCEPPCLPSSTLWTWAKAGLGPSTSMAPGQKTWLASQLHPCTGLICPHVLLLQHDEKMNLAQLSALWCHHFFFLRRETKRRYLLPLTLGWPDALPITMLESNHFFLPHLGLPHHGCPSSFVINLQLINIRQRNKDVINWWGKIRLSHQEQWREEG